MVSVLGVATSTAGPVAVKRIFGRTPRRAQRTDDNPTPGPLAYAGSRGRWVLAASVLGSGLASIDATAVNVALPAVADDLDAGIGGLAWIVNAYTLTLAGLILLGGSLGDLFGRRRIFLIGVTWFAAASLLCGVAPNLDTLIAARALQGVGGALLTPGSLAILQSYFRREDRARVIGAWSGLSGVAAAAGPFLGGWLVQVASWRWVFLINLPVAAAVLLITARHVPETADPNASRRIDVAGAAAGALGLGGLTYGLSTWASHGLNAWPTWLSLVGGVAFLLGFVVREKLAQAPMLPLSIFGSKLFTATNAVTLAVYAALAGVFFWLVLELQMGAGYSPMAAGLSLLPVTALLLLLSARVGAWSQQVGPRLPMTAGPLLGALGVIGLTRVDTEAVYAVDVFLPLVVLGLGLAITVAPLTATVLAAVSDEHAGLASGVNNAVARVAALLAISALPLLAGSGAEDYRDPAMLTDAYQKSMWICASLLATGGLLSALFVRNPTAGVGTGDLRQDEPFSCPVDSPPLRTTSIR